MSSPPAVGTDPDPDRDAEIAAALARVEARITRACSASGRARGDVTLIAVTKTRPAADVLSLLRLGIGEFGENRDREAAAKVAEVRAALAALAGNGEAPEPGVVGITGHGRWHLIGQLQTNKARSVAGWADLVHSVDRARLVAALDTAASRAGRVLDCLVQVDLDPAASSSTGQATTAAAAGDPADPSRGGAPPTDVPALADAIAGAGSLRLCGVMAVGPPGMDPAAAFAVLAEVAAALRADHPGATVVSAGMSGDLEAAVAAGATHLRVGSALLGSRPPLH